MSETLTQRSADAATTQPPVAPPQSVEYLVFVTRDRKLAVPITDVREIRSWSEPTPLPHAPPHLLGVVNLRGTVLPVIDLALRLKIDRTPAGARNVFVVVEVDGRPIGLLVEAVADIHKSNGEDRQPVPATAEGSVTPCIESLLLANDAMIQILDLPALSLVADDAVERQPS